MIRAAAIALLLVGSAQAAEPETWQCFKPGFDDCHKVLPIEYRGTSAEPKITHGYVDGYAHPYVGAIAWPGNTGHMLAHGSGVLVDQLHFVTCAHVASTSAASERVTVTFESVITDAIPRAANGTLYVSRDIDLGVVVLDERQMWAWHYNVKLPRTYRFDSSRTLGMVGYGVSDYRQDPNVYAKVRQYGYAHYSSGSGEEVRLKGANEACWQDSGGPVFDGELLVGVIVSGDDKCQDHTGIQRLDTAKARAFLAEHGVLVP